MRTQTWVLLGGLAGALGLWWYSRTQSGGDAISGALGSAVDSVTEAYLTITSGPRGIRNNNPGNIERNNIVWQGELNQDQLAAARIAYDPTFVQFDTPANGVRAIGHVIMAKAARGLVTVDSIIRDYSATDQDAYVANVSAALGVSPGDVIDVQSQLPNLALAIIQQENGQQPYDPNDVIAWVYS